jgi:hypothetical protein
MKFRSPLLLRTTIWVVFTAAALWVAFDFFFKHLPYVGGGSVSYDTYTPPGAAWMFSATGILFVFGVVFLIRRAGPALWLLYTAASVLPLAYRRCLLCTISATRKRTGCVNGKVATFRVTLRLQRVVGYLDIFSPRYS